VSLKSAGGMVIGAGALFSLVVGLANVVVDGAGVWVIGLDTGSTTFSVTSG